MASIFDYISDNLNRFKFLKWVQIIKTESEATKRSALYLLEKSSTAFEVIVTDDSGAKRKLSGNINTNELGDLFAKLDASNVSPENAELWRGVIIGDLTDKSEDNSYNKFLAQNADGDLAVSDGRSMMIELPNLLTEQQKLAWKTSMNGGWTTNTMSVAVITPPIVDKSNQNTWISLKGANLNLNPDSFSLQIVDNSGELIVTIPNSQVQLYNNGLDLTFYYNFKDLITGDYKLRIWNGVASYTTPLPMTVVMNLIPIDTGSITWERETYNSIPAPLLMTTGANVSLNIDGSIKALASENIVIASAKSSQVISAGQNFYMQVQINIGLTNSIPNNTANISNWFGLMEASSPIVLGNQTFVNGTIGLKAWFPVAYLKADQGNEISTSVNNPTANLIITRHDGLYTIVMFHGNESIVYTKTASTAALSLNAVFQNFQIPVNLAFSVTQLVTW